ncbi:HOOK protein-domain-containing protein [Mycena belliarum]|uniref:HOOK protein-domain-containing protein n=1 Tax=Mycena belliarum TaxID=1033014 RepID=A0AAD6XGE5_9AGAR|nr:HOOK protein-domain-containing protein [Mycena belliae]
MQMADSQRKEIDAFFNFFASFELARPVATISDLGDGAALFEVLSLVDADYFRQSARPSAQPSDNWVLRFSALKRLYRLMTQYFADVLQKPTSGLDVPDLQAIAKDHAVQATLTMCRLTIAIGVQCEKNKEFIDKIQALSETDQHYLMKAIEQVMSRINMSGGLDVGEASMTEDDHYYQIQSERSQVLSEKETLEKVYQSLLEEHRALQTTYDDAVSEKEDAVSRLRDVRREADSKRSDKGDGMLRGEIDRLRAELQKSEDNLAVAESDLEKHVHIVTDLTKKNEELQNMADEAVRLKDKLDEYRHAADKLQKTENVMEKYKKKLQEGADLRQHVKALEKQNADLVDKNASLEEEYRKVSAFKPLMESYKNQIAELETKHSARTQEIDTLRFELGESKNKLKIAVDERARDSETLELYQERVRELELTSHRPVGTSKPAHVNGATDEFTEAELMGELADADADDNDHEGQGLGGELDDAIAGTTMTDLKLQIRKLKRELEAIKKNEADASRVLVLENLLEDANRMKGRYENDYLAAHREKLVLQRDLEEIRSGKSMGDGAEAAIALRQRLNETIDQLDTLRKEHADLEVQFDTASRELTIAKSDLNLVNKDQLDILATLRESVNEDKVGLEADVDRLRHQNKELSDKNRMQLEQVNALLLEKVNLQSEGIGHREKMLQRERDFGDLRASLSGKDLPEDIKTRLLALHEENVNLKESYKTAQAQLAKARSFIKSQDKLFKEQHAAQALSGTFEEAEASFRSQIRILEEEVTRQKRLMSESTKRYRREQELMLGAVHAMGMRTARNHLGVPQQQPSSWMSMQRKTLSHTLSR